MHLHGQKEQFTVCSPYIFITLSTLLRRSVIKQRNKETGGWLLGVFPVVVFCV